MLKIAFLTTTHENDAQTARNDLSLGMNAFYWGTWGSRIAGVLQKSFFPYLRLSLFFTLVTLPGDHEHLLQLQPHDLLRHPRHQRFACSLPDSIVTSG